MARLRKQVRGREGTIVPIGEGAIPCTIVDTRRYGGDLGATGHPAVYKVVGERVKRRSRYCRQPMRLDAGAARRVELKREERQRKKIRGFK
jgi:hypothetical protein